MAAFIPDAILPSNLTSITINLRQDMKDHIAGWHFKGVTGYTVFRLSPFKQEHLLKPFS